MRVVDGYYRDEGWQFAIADPDEDRQEAVQPEEVRGVRGWRTKAEWLAHGDRVTARDSDGSAVSVPTEAVRDFPDDARIVLRRRVFCHPNADPMLTGLDVARDADATGELVVTFRKSSGPSIRWSAAESGHRAVIEEAVAALQRLLDGEVLDRLHGGVTPGPE